MNTEKLMALLRRIFRRKPVAQTMSDPASVHQMQMTLRMITATRDQEISCDEAYEFLDAYADRISRGEDAAALMPLVHHHLAMCPDCREEFDALLLAMETTQ
jgi:hypothetical protein